MAGRIIFLCAFAKTEVTGGIKTVYAHAEMLGELGFDALVFQPDGHPTWFESRARLVDPTRFKAAPEDVLVFPESLSGQIGDMARGAIMGRKVLFCQNQYYFTTHALVAEPDFPSRFLRFAAPSETAKRFLESVVHLKDVAVIPCHVDGARFAPAAKAMEIALVPHKLPREAAIMHKMFQLKYPELKHVRWTFIDKKSERETAEILGRSSVFLSLGLLESFGLVALEAMAAGAIVVGFNGYGGREYASPQNGFWFAPDQLEETVGALAHAVKGVERDAPEIAAMRDAGSATAARFTKDSTRTALRDFYGSLF